MSKRPYYDKARAALDEAHKACFNHPDRDVLGMSHGPFSGVNVALGIIAELEDYKQRMDERLSSGYRILAPGEMDMETLEAAAKHLEGLPSFGDGRWAARAIRALEARP